MHIEYEAIISWAGFALGTFSQILGWIYMIDAARGVDMPDYDSIRRNINFSYLFGILIMTVMSLIDPEKMGPLCGQLLLLHLLLWGVSLVVGAIMMMVNRRQRNDIAYPVGSAIYKLALTALAMWVLK